MMDCEKFDQVVIDALYGELDELTLAALRRHTEGCPRCQAAWLGLRATRKIGVLPLATAPAGLPARALEFAREAQRNVSWPTRFGRLMSRAAGYAMRPQTAMAAIFMLAIGGAVLFMRPRPERASGQNRVSVTERGEPELSVDDRSRSLAGQRPIASMSSPRRDEPSSGAASAGGVQAAKPKAEETLGDPRMRASGAPGEPAEAPRMAGAVRRAHPRPPIGAQEPDIGLVAPAAPQQHGDVASDLGGSARAARESAPAAAARPEKEPSWSSLEAAKAVEESQGCHAAAPKYEEVAARYPATSAAAEALWGAASCYKALGEAGKARQLFLRLRAIAGYRDRAEAQLSSLAQGTRAAPEPPTRALQPAAKPASPASN